MNRSARIYRVTLCGGAMNLLLLAFKFMAGIVAGSAAMVADAVHSLSDAVTDAVVLLFVHISEKPQDKTHDYGHGKYETLAGVVVGFVLFAVGLGSSMADWRKCSPGRGENSWQCRGDWHSGQRSCPSP